MFPLIRRHILLSGLAVLCLCSPVAQATPAIASVPQRVVVTPESSSAVHDGQIVGSWGKAGGAMHIYRDGRLWKTVRSGGPAITYHYQEDRLERIEYSDGRVQTAIYSEGKLAVLESSSGQRLGLVRHAGPVDKQLGSRVVQGKALMAGAVPSSAGGDLNRILIAIDGWEEHEWECKVTPEGETVCYGRAPDTGSGGDDADDSGSAPSSGGPYYQPESPGSGEGDTGGRGGAGGDPAKPARDDRVPPNLPTQASCIQAAINTFEIMCREVCIYSTNKANCELTSYRLMMDLIAECKVAYP